MRDLISISYLFRYTVLWKLPDFSSLTFLLELTFRCLYLELCSFGTNRIALCCIRHLVELIHTSKTIVSHLYVKVHEFTISFPEGEFCKRDYKGRSGHEVSEPLPQINWLKSMNLKGIWGKGQKGEMKKGEFTPPHNFARLDLDLIQDTILLTLRSHSAASVYPLKKNTIQSRTRSPAHQQNHLGE